MWGRQGDSRAPCGLVPHAAETKDVGSSRDSVTSRPATRTAGGRGSKYSAGKEGVELADGH